MSANLKKRLITLTTAIAICSALAFAYWWGASSTSTSAKTTPSPPSDPTHTNRLIHELSPYLRLHAHNPVDWYPWGPEAIAKAKKEDKPIFLSVGYSSCYWCHVMERLVFSDQTIASQMNQLFVNIKVDREERPDIDEIYMTATQLITGRGGWPNSVFLTPELKPFFAGTYFPPEDSHGRPGFPRVLQALHVAWQENRKEIEKQATNIAQSITRIHTIRAHSDTTHYIPDLIPLAVDHIRTRFDPTNGGLGNAPKFPPDHAIGLLLAHYRQTQDPDVLRIITVTLGNMARGGIRDHIGGGFHRYATDTRWRVPHFEKMLYNQALLAHNYLTAFQITHKNSYRIAAEGILSFVSREMTDDNGGFYSSIDAETDAEEGAYYTWTEEDIRLILSDDAHFFLSCYALAPMPEGASGVIYKIATDSTLAATHNLDVATLHDRLAPLKEKLLKARGKRKRPLLDDKIITAWNGLMIGAYARAYSILGQSNYLDVAQKAADFLLDHLRTPTGDLFRLYREGHQKGNAYQEDYAFAIDGLLHLYKATNAGRYLAEATTLAENMHNRFWDPEDGGYFTTQSQTNLIVRTKSSHDSALPSGNAVALHVLQALIGLTQNPLYAQRAATLTKTFATQAAQTPGAFLHFIHGTMASSFPTEEGSPALLSNHEQIVIASASATPSSDKTNTRSVNVNLAIATGWHIQAAYPSEDYLIPTQISIDNPAAEIIDITYPLSENIMLSFEDQPVAVYTGNLTIPITLAFSSSLSDSALVLSLTYQACDDTRCLPPQTQRIPIKFQ